MPLTPLGNYTSLYDFIVTRFTIDSIETSLRAFARARSDLKKIANKIYPRALFAEMIKKFFIENEPRSLEISQKFFLEF